MARASGSAGNRKPLTPEVERDLERLAEARRDIEAFVPRSVEQRDLVGLLRAMLGYMEANHCSPGEAEEFERWWKYLGAFRRALDFPEMTGPRSRDAFKKLVRLKTGLLLEVAGQGRMGLRMPKRKRGKSRNKKRRRPCVKR